MRYFVQLVNLINRETRRLRRTTVLRPARDRAAPERDLTGIAGLRVHCRRRAAGCAAVAGARCVGRTRNPPE